MLQRFKSLNFKVPKKSEVFQNPARSVWNHNQSAGFPAAIRLSRSAYAFSIKTCSHSYRPPTDHSRQNRHPEPNPGNHKPAQRYRQIIAYAIGLEFYFLPCRCRTLFRILRGSHVIARPTRKETDFFMSSSCLSCSAMRCFEICGEMSEYGSSMIFFNSTYSFGS